MRAWPIWLLLIGFAMVTSCQNQARGFVLPQGDAAEGKQVFIELNCNNCHTIDDIEWNGSPEWEDPNIELGGEVSTIKTYGELVTSIINPSHKISKKHNEDVVRRVDGLSKMESYSFNYVMSVQELIDLVTYLQGEYEVVVPETYYPYYGG